MLTVAVAVYSTGDFIGWFLLKIGIDYFLRGVCGNDARRGMRNWI